MKKIIFLPILSYLIISCSNNSDNNPEEAEPTFRISFSGVAFNDQCQNTGEILDNTFSIRAEYLEGDEVVEENLWSGTDDTPIDDAFIVSGETIRLRIFLDNYIPNNFETGRGTGLENVTITITNMETNEVIYEVQDPFYLLICTDTCPQGELIFNTTTETATIEADWIG